MQEADLNFNGTFQQKVRKYFFPGVVYWVT